MKPLESSKFWPANVSPDRGCSGIVAGVVVGPQCLLDYRQGHADAVARSAWPRSSRLADSRYP